jgi:hypothetical protein
MPIRRVQGGYRYGTEGKVYPTRAGAERQARAIHASQSQQKRAEAKKRNGGYSR